jgi:ribonuclease E
LRSLEEMLIKGATHNLVVRTRADVALYVLNHKRAHLRELETRFRISIAVNADPGVGGQQPFVIERGEQVHSLEAAKAIAAQLPSAPVEIEDEAEEEETAEEGPAEVRISADGESERRHRRRRRRRRGGEDRDPEDAVHEAAAEDAVAHGQDHEVPAAEPGLEADEAEPEGIESREGTPESREESERRRRRRGRRGGRRNRRDRDEAGPYADSGAVEPDLTSAVADFDRPWTAPMPNEPVAHDFGEPPLAEPAPRAESSPEVAAPMPLSAAPEPPAAAIAPAELDAERETPRRRSTVREPAPFVVGTGEAPVPPAPPSPAPEPGAEVETPEEDVGQPRRTGWWSRRIMGKG